jgi:PHD-finger/PHD-zinc-finger like domain
MIIRFPTAQKVKMDIEGKETSKTAYRENISTFHSAFKLQRNLGFKLSIENDTIRTDNINIILNTPKISFKSNPIWNTLRIFKVEEGTTHASSGDEVLTLLEAKIASLLDLESAMDSKLRSLLHIVVDERLKYEKGDSLRQEQQRVLEEYNAVQERRREIDLAFQRQRDQDMDAVCEVCNDGEVTPDNQILFCEACNVAVHQFCYGIERVPEGDYYCIACTFFGREQANIAITRQIERGANIRLTPTPLPINCELCPRKQGAFVRSDTSNHVPNNDGVIVTKWVHVLCAKWQGLNFVDNGKRDCVEDVQKLRFDFRTLGITCYLCEGDRGAYNKCRVPGCKKWMHVTCARAYGHSEVVHGENCLGEVKDNPWTLSCPEHSCVTPPSESVTREQLRLLAKAFPTESLTELKSKPVFKPFSKMISVERRDFLSDIENEKSLIDEVLKRKLNGVRCEVCHTVEEEGKYLTRCVCCGVVFCDSCKLPFDDEFLEAKQYKCQACKYVEEKKSMGLKLNTPRCILCFQPRGWLRVARGYPMKKWPLSKQKEYEKTLFGKKLWAHSICAM